MIAPHCPAPVPKPFQPIHVGNTNLQHRVVLAPMKQAHADKRYILRMVVAPQAGGDANVPGIWSDEQIAVWKLKDGNYKVIGVSAISLEGCEKPCPLTVTEIKEYVQLYATAAENAVLKAGFDGTVTNTQTDEYGSSLENPSALHAGSYRSSGQGSWHKQSRHMYQPVWGMLHLIPSSASCHCPQLHNPLSTLPGYEHLVKPTLIRLDHHIDRHGFKTNDHSGNDAEAKMIVATTTTVKTIKMAAITDDGEDNQGDSDNVKIIKMVATIQRWPWQRQQCEDNHGGNDHDMKTITVTFHRMFFLFSYDLAKEMNKGSQKDIEGDPKGKKEESMESSGEDRQRVNEDGREGSKSERRGGEETAHGSKTAHSGR
ncbi:hypothetical protein EDB85DRAFT_1888124 [Lactarius pseudohatsudake]|nr:hypothetical protein EDB85DRAFT_1888124 [Lactarius pseudohatsudake]